jgi:hypothetical protein
MPQRFHPPAAGNLTARRANYSVCHLVVRILQYTGNCMHRRPLVIDLGHRVSMTASHGQLLPSL